MAIARGERTDHGPLDHEGQREYGAAPRSFHAGPKLWRQEDAGVVADVGRRDRPPLPHGGPDRAAATREDEPLVQDLGLVAGEREHHEVS